MTKIAESEIHVPITNTVSKEKRQPRGKILLIVVSILPFPTLLYSFPFSMTIAADEKRGASCLILLFHLSTVLFSSDSSSSFAATSGGAGPSASWWDGKECNGAGRGIVVGNNRRVEKARVWWDERLGGASRDNQQTRMGWATRGGAEREAGRALGRERAPQGGRRKHLFLRSRKYIDTIS